MTIEHSKDWRDGFSDACRQIAEEAGLEYTTHIESLVRAIRGHETRPWRASDPDYIPPPGQTREEVLKDAENVGKPDSMTGLPAHGENDMQLPNPVSREEFVALLPATQGQLFNWKLGLSLFAVICVVMGFGVCVWVCR